MARAARRGHQVVFVETGSFVGRHLWDVARRPGRHSLAQRLLRTEHVAPGVRVRKALNVLPWGRKYRLANAVNAALTAALVRRLGARLPEPLVLWIYDPGAAGTAGRCRESLAVYDCVDDYAEQAASPRRRELVVARDLEAASRAGVVFATSTTVFERQRRRNERTHLVPNAGDYEHFRAAADRAIAAPEAAALDRPVLGFAGNFLLAKVDFDLLESVARARIAWTLLLVGPAPPEARRSLARLTSLPNVRWLGPRPYTELPRFVAAFDVGLIPYRANAYTRSCFPLKLYEYLAAGKPVVASGVPEVRGLDPDVVLADGAPAFVRAVEEALERRGEAERKRRMELASRNSWEARAARQLELVALELEG